MGATTTAATASTRTSNLTTTTCDRGELTAITEVVDYCTSSDGDEDEDDDHQHCDDEYE